MNGKKAWIRIMEAFIAVLIIAGMLFLSLKEKPKSNQEPVILLEKSILEEISGNPQLREEILIASLPYTPDPASPPPLVQYIKERTPPGINSKIMICEIADPCLINQKNVVSSETIITATPATYNPRKIKIFMYEG